MKGVTDVGTSVLFGGALSGEEEAEAGQVGFWTRHGGFCACSLTGDLPAVLLSLPPLLIRPLNAPDPTAAVPAAPACSPAGDSVGTAARINNHP